MQASTSAELTSVPITQDHLAVARQHTRLADGLQAKLDAAAGLQLGQSERKVIAPVDEGDLSDDVVRAIQEEGSDEVVGELAIQRAVPTQRHAGAVPRRHLEVSGDVWVWMEEIKQNIEEPAKKNQCNPTTRPIPVIVERQVDE